MAPLASPPLGGRSADRNAFANRERCKKLAIVEAAGLPPSGGDVRQDRGGQRRASAPHIFALRGGASMTRSAAALRAFLTTATRAALVEITTAQGSTPREEGAWMLVSPNAIFGTIGGGQLEYMAIDKARQLLAAALPSPLREGSARSAGMGVVHQLAPHPFPYRGEPRVSPVLRTPVKYGERGASTSTPGFSSPVQAPAPAPPSPRPSRGSEGRARHVARPGTGKGEGLVRGKAQNPVDGKILLEGKVRAAPILLDIPLGPEIGQCCGGRVGLTVQLVDDDIAAALLSQAEAQDAALPSVYLFGGGHVGRGGEREKKKQPNKENLI